MSLSLRDSVSRLQKVGPAYSKLLQKLEIFTVRDLLYHFPFRYNDYSKTKAIDKLIEGEEVTVSGEIEAIQNVLTRNHKKLTLAKLKDSQGKDIDLIWFNQFYLAKTLKKGLKLNVSGVATIFNGKLSFISPEYELIKLSEPIHTGRLVPTYQETYGISSKMLRILTNLTLPLTDLTSEDILPSELLIKYSFPSFEESIKEIHFPTSFEKNQMARKRFAFEEAFLYMLRLERLKKEHNLKSAKKTFHNASNLIADFINLLPFTPTNSQLLALKELAFDIEAKKPMNRLLQGDVGSGKTAIAMFAAFVAANHNSKTCIIAPTEILALQHFESFKALFKNSGFSIGINTASNKTKEACLITIGTHAVLYKKEELGKFDMVIIDEQHKFGVGHRAQLANASETEAPHTLSMTATPIPRTLALTLFGNLDITTLSEKPAGRQKVATFVVAAEKRTACYTWIEKTIVESGGQVQAFIVCPLIEESEVESLTNVKAAKKEYDNLSQKVFIKLKVGLIHGQMKPTEKEKVIQDFKNKRLNILVATPVIEVGVDIPSASIVVIETAERFGLSQLHQIRGRVGRNSNKAYCLIFTESQSSQTIKRLKLLEKTDDGFQLSEEDLKLRGQGELAGFAQHGHIRFKLADPFNLTLMKSAQQEAKKMFSKIQDYPLLYGQIYEKTDTVAN
ncbi:MAG: ATP-dependent DNA helicase RecG [Patescibacteria group bacterium]